MDSEIPFKETFSHRREKIDGFIIDKPRLIVVLNILGYDGFQ